MAEHLAVLESLDLHWADWGEVDLRLAPEAPATARTVWRSPDDLSLWVVVEPPVAPGADFRVSVGVDGFRVLVVGATLDTVDPGQQLSLAVPSG